MLLSASRQLLKTVASRGPWKRGSRHAILGSMIRVACYVDGFNVYHAIDDMSRATRGELNHLKWLDLRKLMTIFTDPAVHNIVSVKYFSAYATWKPQQCARHKVYVAALENTGVDIILGQFKEKQVFCKNCLTFFTGHEEKGLT